MPSAEERKKNLIEYSKTLNHTFTELDIDIIISGTPDFSLTEYMEFGRNNEREKLRNLIKK
jgi:hypothetical protein